MPPRSPAIMLPPSNTATTTTITDYRWPQIYNTTDVPVEHRTTDVRASTPTNLEAMTPGQRLTTALVPPPAEQPGTLQAALQPTIVDAGSAVPDIALQPLPDAFEACPPHGAAVVMQALMDGSADSLPAQDAHADGLPQDLATVPPGCLRLPVCPACNFVFITTEQYYIAGVCPGCESDLTSTDWQDYIQESIAEHRRNAEHRAELQRQADAATQRMYNLTQQRLAAAKAKAETLKRKRELHPSSSTDPP
jgi:hypothetical protein